MTTIYIAGPMTGVPDYNFPLFFEVATKLRARGYTVQNPATNNGPTLELALADVREGRKTWAQYMRLDLVRLARADAICLLPGWHNSRGARLEATIANELGMPMYRWSDLTIDGSWGMVPYRHITEVAA